MLLTSHKSHMNRCLIISLAQILAFIIVTHASPKSVGDWAQLQREADNLCRKNKHEDAAKLYQQVIKGRLPLQGNRHRDIGVAWNTLGVALYYQGKNDQAEESYEKAIAILLPAIGAQHPHLLSVKANLAFIEESKNNFKNSEKLFRELIDRKLPIIGAKNAKIADCQEGLALSLIGQEKYEEAQKILENVLQTRLEILGKEHTDVGATHAAIAIICLHKADFDLADKHDTNARNILSKTKGTYPLNLNTVSKLRPEPADLLHAKNKDLRIP